MYECEYPTYLLIRFTQVLQLCVLLFFDEFINLNTGVSSVQWAVVSMNAWKVSFTLQNVFAFWMQK